MSQPVGGSRRAHLLGAAAFAVCVLVMTQQTARTAGVSLNITGSTLLYPLFQLWIPDYQKANPDATITAQGTGSGAGIDQAIAGTAKIGASDAYMSDEQMESHSEIVNVPLAISAQVVTYNIPDLKGATLKLSGPAPPTTR